MSVGEPAVELIPFENPSEARLLLPQILWYDSREDLASLLKERLSRHGLVHSVYVDRCTKPRGNLKDYGPCWFAYVDFYSPSSSQRALTFSHQNLIVSGHPCAVVKSKRTAKTDLPLALRKCEELANFYLGFNGWNSEMLYHRLEETHETDTTLTVKYCTVCKLSFPCGLSAEGAGLAEATFPKDEKPAQLGLAQKRSRSTALQNAFSKVILVVVDGRKAMVEVDSTKTDPFFYDPIWETYGADVRWVDYEVPPEEEGD